ncbi:MAG TPA: extracellular solute-binding protein [Bacillota bacterium]|nr:extracellular solute-binding protein [Fastidiosipila sp.]HPX93569.1 extracellular solute-binding protein [Bacillota bacterium]HQB80544.1 extracellular solute-binding protein [Bacillota bacterium]
MKKYLMIILALVLVFALVAGCAPKVTPEPTGPTEPAKTEGAGEPEPPTGLEAAEITVQVEKEWMAYYEAAAKRITDANPDVKIHLQEIGSFDHIGILDETDASNPDVADVFALPADRLTGLAGKDLLGAIDGQKIAARLGGWSNFDDGLGGLFKLDGEYLAFPFNIETLVVFANVKNAGAEGIDPAKTAELDEVENPAHILLPVFDAWFGVALTNSADIALLKEEGDGFVSDLTTAWGDLEAGKKAALTVLYNYWKLNYDSNSTLFDPEAGWGYIDEKFTSGNSGVFRIGGPWETGAMKGMTNDGQDLGIYPIGHITVAGQPLRHWQGGWGLAINPRIEEDQAKVELAEAMIGEIVNPEYAVDLFKATGKILENVTAGAYAASDLDEIDKKVIAAVIDSFHVSPGRPLFQEFGPVWDTWKNAVLSWNSVVPAGIEAAYGQLKASFDAMMADLK